MTSVTFTHKGWFGLCPIYISEPYSEGPTLEPRIPYTGWFLDLQADIYGIFFNLVQDEDPMWPIKITGELKKPVVMDFEEIA